MADKSFDVQNLRDTVDFYRKWFITICVPLLSLLCAYLTFKTESSVMDKSNKIFATKEALVKTEETIKEHSERIHNLVPYKIYEKDFSELRSKVVQQGEIIASMNATLKSLQENILEIKQDVKSISRSVNPQ